jgi:hypothetical protein
VSTERAETYLRLLSEAHLRRLLPRPAAASHADVVRAVVEIDQAGQILAAAGLVAGWSGNRAATELKVALNLRSRSYPARSLRQLSWELDMIGRPPPAETDRPAARTARPLRLTPIASTVSIHIDRAPLDLQLMTLVSTPDEAAITAAIRVRWPPDGSSIDLEVTGPGYHLLPYDRLEAVDDRGSRYSVRFGGEGGNATWQGIVSLSPAPSPGASWLDLIADGTRRLIRLDLTARTPASATGAQVSGPEDLAGPPGERLLAVAAERIIARSWPPTRTGGGFELGEMIRVLTDAGAIAADSATPGQLAALCQRLGVSGSGSGGHGISGHGISGHGIAAAPATEIPAPWASVVAQREAGAAGRRAPEVFAPLGVVLPDIEGTRLAIAGLSMAAGESFLHVVGSGLRQLESIYGWDMGFSWWLRDGAGHWHVAVPDGAAKLEAAPLESGEAAFSLRLTPPLAAPPDTLEVVVRGRSARLRAIVPVRPWAAGSSGHGRGAHLSHEPPGRGNLSAGAGRGRDARSGDACSEPVRCARGDGHDGGGGAGAGRRVRA